MKLYAIIERSRMKKRILIRKKLLTAVLIGSCLLATAGCGKKEQPADSAQTQEMLETEEQKAAGKLENFDLISAIDLQSVTQEGEYTNFNVLTADGRTIRFQGLNIEVTEDGIRLGTGAVVASLDYMGKMESFSLNIAEPGCDIFFGPVFSNEAGAESLKNLFIAAPYKMWVSGETEQDLSFMETGFAILVAENGGNNALLTSWKITCDGQVPQTLYSDLEPGSEAAQIITDFALNWDTLGEISADELARQKMGEPGALTSDIIAGIDYDSIVKEGSSTFFSSQMSDGTIVRFEGHHISIGEDGITIYPDSEVTSLDAIGKIYLYQAQVKDAEQYELQETDGGSYYATNLDVGYGYTYSADKLSVKTAEEVHTYPYVSCSPAEWSNGAEISLAYLEPNFVYFSGSGYNEENFVVSSLTVGYNPAEKVTGIRAASFNSDWTGAYLEGDLYNAGEEGLADSSAQDYSFYLILEPDTAYADMNSPHKSICFVPESFYTVGDLKDASGSVLDKRNAHVYNGTTLDIKVGDYNVALALETLEQYLGADTMHDLVPYAYPEAVGTLHALVVPVAWADQTENATEAALLQYKKALGRVEGAEAATDYSDLDDEEFSLSEYFDIASYGQLEVNSFLTDWYYTDKTFAEYQDMAPDKSYADEVLAWVKATYPDLDWTRYDQDGNGYVDAMIIINAGAPEKEDSYNIISYGGAIHYRESYYGDYAGTQQDPSVNCYVTVNQRFLQDGNTAALIHEFSHNFGLIDYYDVNYSGIDAVGGYDMQSQNQGDWNAYSKLAAGWMNPQVVEKLASGETVELTIGAMALTNDVIVIPAAGTDYEGAFSEYIMIDLFTDAGVNAYDAAEYGLQGTTGVRISHVDARMEKRTMEIDSKVNLGETDTYEIGTIHYANNYTSDGRGFYNIEVIQSGKVNTFTDLSNAITRLSAEDLFYAGDEFSVEAYSAFFYQGLMDDGSEFGYVISVVDIGENADGTPNATVRITAK